MKRKLEDTDGSFFLENPLKMQPSPTGGYYGYNAYNTTGTVPEQIGRPMLASTPHAPSATNRVHRRLTTQQRQRMPATTLHTTPAADSELRHVIDNFVNIYEQLDKTDNATVKPNYSYSELAYLAMLRSPNFCLPIGQIYSYIQSRFRFFRNSTRKHWKNAVRHSLAKTMCFTKIPVGRGTSSNENLARSTYLWCILPNSIACFARGDYRATIDKETGTNTLRSAYFRMDSESFWNSIGDYIADKMALFRKSIETSSNPGVIFESQTCSIPWEQKIHYNYQSPDREVFQNVQNQQHVEHTTLLRDRGVTSAFAPELPYCHTTVSPEMEYPNMPTSRLRMFDAHARSSSPVLRISDAQSQNSMSYTDRNSSSTDPWLSELAATSPATSICGIELGHNTPAYTLFDSTDSGFETSNASQSNNSCKFLSSCKQQINDRFMNSPGNIQELSNSDLLADSGCDFSQFDLSPFSISDFSDLPDNFSGSLEQSNVTPEKFKPSTDPVLFNIPQFVGQPMLISTPVSSGLPRNSQCQFVYQPRTPAYNTGRRFSSTQVPDAPVYFVNGNGMFSAAVLPQWDVYC